MATRRAFLASLAAISLPRLSWADVGSPAYLAAGKMGDDFVLHGLSHMGQSLFRIPLPARGHAAAAHPNQPHAVAFARRPGTFALVIDCFTGAVLHQLTPPEGRQFNGHGAFSADGTRLMTSEVIAETAEGRIGLWDAETYRRIGEWASGGIGPHDLKRLADGRIVVANGGIQTDPTDRAKLNLPDMQPNLTLLSPDGTILDQVQIAPDLHRNSIRHLALLGGTVAFAMQWEGDPAEPVPQLGLWTPGTAPRLCPPADAQAFAMMGYAGSIAATKDRIAMTSPKGGVLMIFDAEGRYVATHQRADLSGVAPGITGFVATDGQGAMWNSDDNALTLLGRNDTLWDNHLIPVT
ncbi:MAG: DUF1513 domain-containing protein [Paracoccaceae bacterium]